MQLSKREKAPLFYTPNEAAYACKLLVERAKILLKLDNDLSN